MDLEFLKKRLSVYEWFLESYNVYDSLPKGTCLFPFS